MSKVEGFDDLTGGQLKALCVKLGGVDVVNAVLRGEMGVEFKEIIKKFFDKNGRRIPEGLRTNVCDANNKFYLDQPMIADKEAMDKRLGDLYHFFGNNFGVTSEQLLKEIGRLLQLIVTDPQIANIANGVILPVVLPKLLTDDLGEELEKYLEAVGKSYTRAFPDRKFNNYYKETLAENVSIVPESRHEQLIKKMKQGPVIGLHFPNPLQGFSVYAQREQTASLSEGFILSGFDTAIAMAMYPDILARDYSTPGLDIPVFSWESASHSLLFKANDDELDFNDNGTLGYAFVAFSGGLLFVG